MATCTGRVPVAWRSGTSIRWIHSSKKGNKILESALFFSVFAPLELTDQIPRRLREETRRGTHRSHEALILARRRRNLLFAMLRDGTLHQAPETAPA